MHGIRDWGILANIEVPPDLFTPCRARERARRAGGQRQHLLHNRFDSQPGSSSCLPSDSATNIPSVAFQRPSLFKDTTHEWLSEAELRGLVNIDSSGNMSSTSNTSTESPVQAVRPHDGGHIRRSAESNQLPARHRSHHLVPLHDLEVHRHEHRSRRRSVADEMYLRALDRRAFPLRR